MRLKFAKVVHSNFLNIVNNDKNWNCRHENERPVNFNQVTFRTNYALNKCRICVVYK